MSMTKKIQPVIGARLPPAIMEFVDKEIESGEYYSRSDWVRDACREFYKKRVEYYSSNKK